MRPFAATANSTHSLADIANEYELRGIHVASGATGISLFTDETVCAIELPRELSAKVRGYLQANGLLSPVVRLPGNSGAELHIAVGLGSASRAAKALEAAGAKIYAHGDVVPLPPTKIEPGEAKWAVSLEQAQRVQPLVVIGAAVRAVQAQAARTRRAS